MQREPKRAAYDFEVRPTLRSETVVRNTKGRANGNMRQNTKRASSDGDLRQKKAIIHDAKGRAGYTPRKSKRALVHNAKGRASCRLSRNWKLEVSDGGVRFKLRKTTVVGKVKGRHTVFSVFSFVPEMPPDYTPSDVDHEYMAGALTGRLRRIR